MSALKFRLQVFSCFFFFLLGGIVYSQVTARMPALKAHAGVDEAGIGLALSCLGAGSLLGFSTIAFLLKKLPSRTVLSLAAFGCLAMFFAVAFVYNLATLCVVFALVGTFFAYFDVAMNTQVINLELFSGGHYMLRMHAAYNIGALSGSILGAIFAYFMIGVEGNFISVGLFFLILAIFCSMHLVPDAKPQKTEGRRRAFKLPLFVLVCGILAMCAYTIEGSIAEWGGLVMHQEKAAPESLAALVYGTFSLVTAFTRFAAEYARRYVGDYKLLFLGALIALGGMSTVIYSASPYVTLLGYALCGVGLAPLVPLLLSKVGHRADITPAAGATVISLFGYGGMLIIPPSLGFLATHYGLINALYLPLGLICAVALGAGVLRRLR